jgi:uncharacterized protein YunC (DUF1805 family)
MKLVEIKIGNKTAAGFEIALPNAMIVLARGKKGFVMCGYLNLDTAEKLKDAACVVKGVKTIDDLLKAQIAGLSSEAEKLGIRAGMTGREALELLV